LEALALGRRLRLVEGESGFEHLGQAVEVMFVKLGDEDIKQARGAHRCVSLASSRAWPIRAYAQAPYLSASKSRSPSASLSAGSRSEREVECLIGQRRPSSDVRGLLEQFVQQLEQRPR
jgi:hypothetical protein